MKNQMIFWSYPKGYLALS